MSLAILDWAASWPMILPYIDCKNLYVSCERVFRPDLEGVPVIVHRTTTVALWQGQQMMWNLNLRQFGSTLQVI